MGRSRDIAAFLGKTEAANTTNLGLLNSTSASVMDSAGITQMIDSSYIQLRQTSVGSGGIDSAATLTLVNFEAGVFRINSQNLSTNHTIDSADNGMVAGPLTIDSGVTLIISGNLTVV